MQIYHGQDLRKGRYLEAGRPYLVTTVTYGRRQVFRDWRVGRLLVAELRAATESGLADSVAWVVMPDHLHWLMVPRGEALDRIMRRVKSRSAVAIRREQGGYGRLWQRGYHDHAVRREEDLRECARYIVGNPLRAGLVERLGDYPLWDAVWL
jgi:putative transposase